MVSTSRNWSKAKNGSDKGLVDGVVSVVAHQVTIGLNRNLIMLM